MKSAECPVCGMTRRAPFFPSVHTTPWTDECGCSDSSLCMYHKLNDEPVPERPPKEIMEARAQAVFEQENKRYEERVAKFELHRLLEEENKKLKEENELLKAWQSIIDWGYDCSRAPKRCVPQATCQKCLREGYGRAMAKDAAEKQREACAAHMYRHARITYADTVRATPLVTERDK